MISRFSISHIARYIWPFTSKPLLTLKRVLVMSNENKKWLKQTAAVINAIVERRKYSKATLLISPDDAWFEDSCNFIGLVCDLQDFAATLKNMVKYAEMSENV